MKISSVKKPEKRTRIFKRHASNKTITLYNANSRLSEEVKLIDIGMGGLSFKMNKKLKIGSSAYVVSTNPDKPDRVKVQVSWVKENGGMFTIGVVFPDQRYTDRAAVIGNLLPR